MRWGRVSNQRSITIRGGRAELPEAYLAAQLPAIVADTLLFPDPGRGWLTITAFLSIG